MVELILIIGLFYPQIGLLVGYLTNSLLPNDVPFFGGRNNGNISSESIIHYLLNNEF